MYKLKMMLRIPLRRFSTKYLVDQIKFQSSTSNAEWQQPQGTDTGISVYNCVAKKRVPLILNENLATWYSCGPTVYDSAHIGHASCYVKLDIIQRILKHYFQINLITSMGITDIDDKIILRSQKSKKKPEQIAQEYELEFWKNMTELGVMKPCMITRVSEHISTIKDFIAQLARKNLTYVGQDKSVYFDTEAYGSYGKLQKAQENQTDEDPVNKKSSADFALWKANKPDEPFWPSQWGNGRPGWHIECSAMVSSLFGKTVDFHAGGVDLQFPHHENEEAQSCAYHENKQWVNYWLHPGHLHISGDVKMSKSANNSIKIDKFFKSFDASTFRMACILSHYRNPMEYSIPMMKNAKAVVLKFKYFLESCSNYLNNQSSSGVIDEVALLSELEESKKTIKLALRDDFDTAKCVTSLINLSSKTTNMFIATPLPNSNPETFKPITIYLVSQHIKDTLNCFGLNVDKIQVTECSVDSEIIDAFVKFRQAIRTKALQTDETEFIQECDKVRDTLRVYITINDKAKGETPSWVFTK